MDLIHSFPRPKENSSEDTALSAVRVIDSIFRFGLLCTPEELNVYPDPHTLNKKKKDLIKKGIPEYVHPQSRICFTLCYPQELFVKKVRGLRPGRVGPVASPGKLLSHADLFGDFSIILDPIVSRQFGLVPTIYYSPDDLFVGRRNYPSPLKDSMMPGMSLQLINRLSEIRGLLILLALVEKSAKVKNGQLPSEEVLRESAFDLAFESDLVERAAHLAPAKRKEILGIFSNDRESAAVLKSAVELLLSLFQQTDHYNDKEVLAFFEQREWRLVHHNRDGLKWYSLGKQSYFKSSIQDRRENQIRELRRFIGKGSYKKSTEDYLKHCWILESVDGEPIQSYIKSVICPSKHREAVSEGMGKWSTKVRIHDMEEFVQPN